MVLLLLLAWLTPAQLPMPMPLQELPLAVTVLAGPMPRCLLRHACPVHRPLLLPLPVLLLLLLACLWARWP